MNKWKLNIKKNIHKWKKGPRLDSIYTRFIFFLFLRICLKYVFYCHYMLKPKRSALVAIFMRSNRRKEKKPTNQIAIMSSFPFSIVFC